MVMIRTRSGTEQYLVPPERLTTGPGNGARRDSGLAPERLTKVPGNVVQVALSVTPNLRHVRSVSVMGQRQMARAEPPVPTVLRRMQRPALGGRAPAAVD